MGSSLPWHNRMPLESSWSCEQRLSPKAAANEGGEGDLSRKLYSTLETKARFFLHLVHMAAVWENGDGSGGEALF